MMRSWGFESRSAKGLSPSLAVLCLVGAIGACASQLQCKNVEGQEQCAPTGGGGEAAVTGAAAGALWVGGGGCNIAGCRPPMTCNPKTGFCEHLQCGEGSGRCPDGTRCDARTHSCR
jgi:hypothetical protein